MKSAIRMFALLVAIAGLASASLRPRYHATHASANLGECQWPRAPRPSRPSALRGERNLPDADRIDSLIALGALLHSIA